MKRKSHVYILTITAVLSLMFQSACKGQTHEGNATYDDDTDLDFRWKASEGNVHHYNVYVSIDGGEFARVGTTDTNSYVLKGAFGHSYRLKVEPVGTDRSVGPISPPSDVVICRTKSEAKLPPVEPLPEITKAFPNFPNPTNPDTWFPYQLASDANVLISIYNVLGETVQNILLEEQKKGFYLNKESAAYWDGKNLYGEIVGSGLYFYRLIIKPHDTTIVNYFSGKIAVKR